MSIVLIKHKFKDKWLSKRGWTTYQENALIYYNVWDAARRVETLNMKNLVIYEEYSVRLRKTYEDKNLCE